MGHPPRGRGRTGSFQISFGLQQLSIEQCRPGSATDRVVGEQGKFPVEYRAWTKPSDGCSHAATEFNIETGLRSVGGVQVANRNFGSGRELLLLWDAGEFSPRFENV